MIHAPADENPHRGYHAELLDACAEYRAMVDKLEAENAALRELTARMATEMREVDHEFASLRDYNAARKEAQPIRADHSGDINEMMQKPKEAQP